MTSSQDPRMEILRLLRVRDEQVGEPLPTLDDLEKAIGLSRREVRRACDALEVVGHVEGAHGMGGDNNPSYFITDGGKGYLYNQEH